MHKPHPISDQNGQNLNTLFQTKKAQKPYPLVPHIPKYIAYIRENTSSKYGVSVASTDLMKETDILLTMMLLLTFVIDTLPNFSVG